MAEYIERETLMLRIKEIHCAECDSYHGVRCRACWVDDTLDYIDSEPAADVEPVRHGRWGVDGVYVVCSVCNSFTLSPIVKQLPTFKYCPNCGARMDEVSE